MFSSVIWATDGSPHADRALAHAVQIAGEDHAAFHVVHIVETFVTGRVAGQDAYLNEQSVHDKVVQQAEQITTEEIKPIVHIASGKTGDAAGHIASVAREIDADLIVIGTRGHSPIAGALLGSVTQRLLHIAPCPVLAVPPAVTQAADQPDVTASAR